MGIFDSVAANESRKVKWEFQFTLEKKNRMKISHGYIAKFISKDLDVIYLIL